MSIATVKATQFIAEGQQQPAAIDVQNVQHFFGVGEARKQVLYDNCLAVQPGEIVIMTGQSGSGKTTLLTLIGTLRRIQDGQLRVLGQPLHDSSVAEIVRLRQKIGFIFQAHNLFTSLTALQNVRMALELQPDRLSRREQDDRCREILNSVGLGERIDYKPAGLSGGQKQRVAAARGLVHQPEILLADEPTAALDEESGRQVVTLFQRAARERGTAILIVTHDNRILDVADRIVKMDFGHIARDTRVKEASLIAEMMRKCKVFDGVSFSTLNRLADRMEAHRYAPGSRVIQQGDPGDRFYMIRDGQFLITRDGTACNEIGPGQFFGEAALITGEPRNAHVDALTDAVVFSLDAQSFQEALSERKTTEQEVRSTLFAD